MKLILIEDVTNLGSLGDIIEVTAGYARNHLLPRWKMKANLSPKKQKPQKKLFFLKIPKIPKSTKSKNMNKYKKYEVK